MESQLINRWGNEPNQSLEYGDLIAIVDESEAFDVDIVELWKKGDTYFLLTASGCSCWEGEFETRQYKSLDDLQADLRGPNSDSYMYNPSLAGLQQLIEQARSNV